MSAWRDTTWETQTTETGFQLAVLRDKNGSKTKVAGFLRDMAGKKTVLGFFCNDPRRWLDLNVDLTVRLWLVLQQMKQNSLSLRKEMGYVT